MTLSEMERWSKKREYARLKQDLANEMNGRSADQISSMPVEDQNLINNIMFQIDMLRSELDGDVEPPTSLPAAVRNIDPTQLKHMTGLESPIPTVEKNSAFTRFVDPTNGTVQGYGFAKNQKMADVFNDYADIPNACGQMVVAMVTGNRRNLPSVLRNQLSEGVDSEGGYTVPQELLGRVWDKARAMSAIGQTNAQMFSTGSDNLRVPKLLTDPVVEVKAENDPFTGSDITFGAVDYTPFLAGCFVKSSRELFDDGVGVAAAVENAMAQALAVGMDQLALNGAGTTEPLGILNDTSIGQTAAFGKPTWEGLSAEATTIRTANYEPSYAIFHPAELDVLRLSTSGDGTNAAKTWLGAPPTLANVGLLSTTNCPTDVGLDEGEGVIGQFEQSGWCIRNGIRMETSTQAGDAFARHQIWLKIWTRFDYRVLVPDAFRRLAGVSVD